MLIDVTTAFVIHNDKLRETKLSFTFDSRYGSRKPLTGLSLTFFEHTGIYLCIASYRQLAPLLRAKELFSKESPWMPMTHTSRVHRYR